MRGQAIVAGARGLLLFLLKAIVFPLAWMWALGIAKRHSDADPAGRRKVTLAIIVGLVAAPAIGYLAYDFQEDARAGMYANMEARLSVVYGANAYSEQEATATNTVNVNGILAGALADAEEERKAALASFKAAQGDVAIQENLTLYEEAVDKVVELQLNLDLSRLALDQASLWRDRLVEERAFFTAIHDEILAQDDDGLRAAVAARADAMDPGSDADLAQALLDAEKDRDGAKEDVATYSAEVEMYKLLARGRGLSAEETEAEAIAKQNLADASAELTAATDAVQAALSDALAAGFELPVPKDAYNSENIEGRTERWLGVKDKAESAMAGWMNYLIFPGLIGVFYAPLFFALGGIMERAWDPSETVGYKKYPGKSLGLFLFFGAFGWPSLLFSAWGFWDLDVRSQEGQISL